MRPEHPHAQADRWGLRVLTVREREIAEHAAAGTRLLLSATATAHPELTEPSQRSRQSCAAWLAMVNRLAIGDYVQRHHHIHARAGKPASPRSSVRQGDVRPPPALMPSRCERNARQRPARRPEPGIGGAACGNSRAGMTASDPRSGMQDLRRRGGFSASNIMRCIMCQHQPPCPPADAPDREAARSVITHPEQGWSLLCNGVVVFEDTGALLPDGRSIPPRRPDRLRVSARLAPAAATGDSMRGRVDADRRSSPLGFLLARFLRSTVWRFGRGQMPGGRVLHPVQGRLLVK
jgi:Family of unknown function (DUF5999)